MTPGLSTHVFFDQRLRPGLLDALAQSGARTIEVFAALHHFDYNDPQAVRETASWFRSNDVRAVLHQPIYLTDGSRTFSGADPSQYSRHIAPNLNLISERKNARIAAMDEVKRALEAAEQIPFTAAVLHLGLRDTPWDDYAVEHSITAIEHLKAFAGPLGLKLLLENLQNDVTSPSHLLEILRAGHFDNVGIALDLGHLHLTTDSTPKTGATSRSNDFGNDSHSSATLTSDHVPISASKASPLGLTAATLSQILSLLGSRVALVHIHDNHGPFGQVSSPTELHDEHLWPGEGTIDWAAILGALSPLVANVPGILEPAPTRDMPPDQVTRKAAELFSSWSLAPQSA